MSTQARNWLLMADPISAYTFDLFETISELGGVSVRFLHNELAQVPSFSHEMREKWNVQELLWKNASWSDIKGFVSSPSPDAVFVYGTRPRVKMAYALSQIPATAPVWYAADTNIAELSQNPTRTFAQRLAHLQIAQRANGALSLGVTNLWAMQLLGFKRVFDLPVYAIDFSAMDASAKDATTVVKSGREITLLILSRLVPVKNLAGLLTAVADDHDLCSRVGLLIAGEGPEREALEAIAAGAPHLDVRLLGAVPRKNVGALFCGADALLLPSVREPWGIVVTEALGMSVPVIATPAVGAAVSLAGRSGAILLSDTCEPASVVRAIRRFVALQSGLTAHARAGAAEIRSHFDRNAVARAKLDLVYGAR